jgi:uncharacterized membrane protein (DUF485 family)
VNSMSSQQKLPWSFYSTLASFGLFFACVNIYIITKWLNHPLSSDLWLIGIVIGFMWLVYSVRMVRIHQHEMINRKQRSSE